MKSNKIKILYDFQTACEQKYGGVSRYHYELMKQLNSGNECKCEMYALFSQNYYFEKLYGKKAVTEFKLSWKYVSRINKLATIFRVLTHHYDIIHPTWYQYYIPKNRRTKIVITIHDMTQELYMEDKGLIIELKKKCIYNSDHIIAISQNTKNDLLRLYPDISPDKISVVYHGTNHLPKPKKPSKWHCPEKYVLFVGSRYDYKNGMLPIKELNKIIHENNMVIVYAGGGKFNDSEKAFIRKYKMDNHVIQEDVSDAELAYLYQNATCFIYPSQNEGFGFPILEAFDNLCPVICSKSSCFPEIAGDAALYFDLDKEGSMADLVKVILSDNSLRHKLIQAGTERKKEFTWEKTASKMSEIYKGLVYGQLL